MVWRGFDGGFGGGGPGQGVAAEARAGRQVWRRRGAARARMRLGRPPRSATHLRRTAAGPGPADKPTNQPIKKATNQQNKTKQIKTKAAKQTAPTHQEEARVLLLCQAQGEGIVVQRRGAVVGGHHVAGLGVEVGDPRGKLAGVGEGRGQKHLSGGGAAGGGRPVLGGLSTGGVARRGEKRAGEGLPRGRARPGALGPPGAATPRASRPPAGPLSRATPV